MFISWSKKNITVFPKPFFIFLSKWGFTPNRLTVVSAIFKILATYFFFKGELIFGAICIILDYFFDHLDGGVARYSNHVTKRGGIYDFVCDRIFRETWVVALAYGGLISFKLAFWVVLIDMFSYFVSDYAELNDLKQIDWMPANIRFIIFGVLFNKLSFFFRLGIYVNVLITVVNIISLIYLNKEKKEEFGERGDSGKVEIDQELKK